MKHRLYTLPSLFAAGLMIDGGSVPAKTIVHIGNNNDGDGKSLLSIIGATDTYTLAAHRSHSSHGSHRSHRSSSGSGYVAPSRPSISRTPSYSPPPSGLLSNPTRNRRTTPATSVLPSSPAIAGKPKPLKGNTAQFKELLKKLQVALLAFGYYTGAVDGIMGPKLRIAISRYQKDAGYKVTGTVTPEVQNAFGLVVR